MDPYRSPYDCMTSLIWCHTETIDLTLVSFVSFVVWKC
jgi:hypothetical protein